VVYYGEANTSIELESVIQAALFFQDKAAYEFIHIPQKEGFRGVKLYTENREEVLQKSKFSLDDVVNFVLFASSPDVMTMDEKTAVKIFSYDKPAIFLFRDENTHKNADNELREASRQIKDKIFVVASGIEDVVGKRLSSIFMIEQKDLPQIRILDTNPYNAKSLRKFVHSGDITKNSIIEFVDNWLYDKIKPTFKTEQESADTDGLFSKVVGLNFERVVSNADKDVILIFETSYCSYCKKVKSALE